MFEGLYTSSLSFDQAISEKACKSFPVLGILPSLKIETMTLSKGVINSDHTNHLLYHKHPPASLFLTTLNILLLNQLIQQFLDGGDADACDFSHVCQSISSKKMIEAIVKME